MQRRIRQGGGYPTCSGESGRGGGLPRMQRGKLPRITMASVDNSRGDLRLVRKPQERVFRSSGTTRLSADGSPGAVQGASLAPGKGPSLPGDDDPMARWPGVEGKQDQHARSRRVVQAPARTSLIFFQFAQNLYAESCVNGYSCRWPCPGASSELAVHLTPGDPLRSAKREGAVHQPQVEIEALGRSV